MPARGCLAASRERALCVCRIVRRYQNGATAVVVVWARDGKELGNGELEAVDTASCIANTLRVSPSNCAALF